MLNKYFYFKNKGNSVLKNKDQPPSRIGNDILVKTGFDKKTKKTRKLRISKSKAKIIPYFEYINPDYFL